MKLYYYKDPVGNFGDDLNPLIWNHFLPEIFNDDPSEILVGIGTIINSEIPNTPRKLVFGSGVGYGALPVIDDRWKFYCVRGPLSAQRLGLDKALAITDPAILISQLGSLYPVNRHGNIAFMPHHSSVGNGNWKAICDSAGIDFIDPAASISEVISRIRSSRLVIAEAMHGAIVADAFRIPWIPVTCYDHILDFKWRDWCQSLDLEYAPINLPRIWNKNPDIPFKLWLKSEIKHGLNSRC